MAGRSAKKYNIKPPATGLLKRSPRLRAYFYIEDKLHRRIKVDRPNDILRAYCYPDRKIVHYIWTDAKRNMQQAFNTGEVAKLLNRRKENILMHLKNGAINPPYLMSPQKMGEDNPVYRFGIYKWSEDDVVAMHEFYLTLKSGRPRKDGFISAGPRLPTRMELQAMMKQNKLMYIQDADGEFVPIFDQPDWT